LLQSAGFPQKEIYYQLMLTEYYQYRKTDYNLALKHLTNAMQIFVRHPGPYLTNPYLFINVGNLLFKLRDFDHAEHYYRLANDLAIFRENPHGQMVALHNLSLVFRETRKCDSAWYYLSLARNYIRISDSLMIAHNEAYRAELFQAHGNYDSAYRYAEKTIDFLRNFRIKSFELTSNRRNKAWLNGLDINERCQEVFMKIARARGDKEAFYRHCRVARDLATKADNQPALARICFESALMGFMENDARAGLVNADSALHLVRKIYDPFLMQEWLDSLSFYAMSKPEMKLTQKYIDLSKSQKDSLIRIKASGSFSEILILLTSVAAEQAIQRANADRHEKSMIISKMVLVISGLVLFAIAIGTLLIIILMQKRKLDAAYQSLTARIRDSIRIEDELAEKKELAQHTSSSLPEKFAVMMHDNKIFTDPDLSLAGFAERMETNTTYLSRFFNNYYGVSFKDYLNDLRVKEACRMMSNPEHNQHSIDQIFTLAGFSSKASFYSVFRKFTGMSPAAFRSSVNSGR
jgi:AraC-like DNA-binding protein